VRARGGKKKGWDGKGTGGKRKGRDDLPYDLNDLEMTWLL